MSEENKNVLFKLNTQENEEYEFAFDNLQEWWDRTSEKKVYNKCGFLIRGYGMGWRGRTGYKIVKIKEGKDFLMECIPERTDFHAIYYDMGDYLKATISHHDAPTGESYSIFYVEDVIKALFKEYNNLALEFIRDYWYTLTQRSSAWVEENENEYYYDGELITSYKNIVDKIAEDKKEYDTFMELAVEEADKLLIAENIF